MNKNYFKYLINHYKVLFLFICLAEIIISILSPLEDMGYEILEDGLWAISMILTFVFPALLFKHAQNKKEADTYFTLPVSRKEIVITSLLAGYLFIIVPVTFIYLYLFVISKYALASFIFPMIVLWVSIAALLIFNSGIYLVANNEIDGVIIMLAYHFISIILLILESSLNEILYYGYSVETTLSGKLSLIGNSFSLIDNLTCNLYNGYNVLENADLTTFYIICIVYTVLGIISLRNNYLKRKAERAGSISNRITAYPFIIYTFTTIILFSISFDTSVSKLSYFAILSANLFSYALVIILFIVATFVYKRKITIRYKSILYFVLISLLGTGITLGLYKNEGLKLSYQYNHEPDHICINGSINYYSDSMETEFKNLKCDEIDFEYEIDTAKQDPDYQDIMSFFNAIRDQNIKDHFAIANIENSSYLNIEEETYDSKSDNKKQAVKTNYYYYSCVNIGMDELKELSKFGKITIGVYDYDNDNDYYREYTYEEFVELIGGNTNA